MGKAASSMQVSHLAAVRSENFLFGQHTDGVVQQVIVRVANEGPVVPGGRAFA